MAITRVIMAGINAVRTMGTVLTMDIGLTTGVIIPGVDIVADIPAKAIIAPRRMMMTKMANTTAAIGVIPRTTGDITPGVVITEDIMGTTVATVDTIVRTGAIIRRIDGMAIVDMAIIDPAIITPVSTGIIPPGIISDRMALRSTAPVSLTAARGAGCTAVTSVGITVDMVPHIAAKVSMANAMMESVTIKNATMTSAAMASATTTRATDIMVTIVHTGDTDLPIMAGVSLGLAGTASLISATAVIMVTMTERVIMTAKTGSASTPKIKRTTTRSLETGNGVVITALILRATMPRNRELAGRPANSSLVNSWPRSWRRWTRTQTRS